MDQEPSGQRYASLAARLLRPTDRTSGGVEIGERHQAVLAIEGALRARARRRARLRWAAGSAAVAVAAVMVVALGWTRGEVSIRVDGGEVLEAGAVVQVPPDREVGLSLSTGSRLRLRAGGRLGLTELGKSQRFVLAAGRLTADVSALAPGHQFVVTTVDAEVEVRGTSFEVAVVPARAECDGAATEVRVFEGVVLVRRAGRSWSVAAGERWPSGCRAPDQPPPAGSGASAPPASAPGPASRPATAAAPRRSRAPAASPAPISTLVEQNDLFGAAMDARRRGDLDQARRKLDELLVRYPFGALADSARRERASLATLRSTGEGR